MKKLENMLERQLNNEHTVNYPDFDTMWGRVEQSAHATSLSISTKEAASSRRSRNWRRITVAASLSALLAAAPVYAAIQYDWGNVLSSRSGVKAALAQNLGQQLGQSVTKDGVTLTLHTAIVDENRTVILYSLDVGDRPDNESWKVDGLSLKDTAGNNSDGNHNTMQWDAQNQRYHGYFETDWTPQQDTAKITLTADAVRAFSTLEQELPLDSGSSAVQSFPISKDGINTLEVQPFSQNQDKLLLASAVTFDEQEAKEWSNPRIVAYADGKQVKELSGGTIGKPGDNGEYTIQQYLEAEQTSSGQPTFKLQYTKLERNLAGPWTFDLELSKKQMESGTIKTALNVPLETGDTLNSIENMVVTPTQIRLSVRTKADFYQLPYKKYYLEVNGKTLEGLLWEISKEDPSLITLSFERPSDLVLDEQTPITFVGTYKVTIHNDDTTPVLLTNISEHKQTVNKQIGGYPVVWTYYMQGDDLFVETGSADPHFGGIPQTYIGLGKDRIMGKQVTANFDGDGNNKAIDVYKNFKGNEASIYMLYYSSDEPDKETRVQLRP